MREPILILAERIAGDVLMEKVKSSYQIKNKGIENLVCVVETMNRKVVVRMNSKETYPILKKEEWCIQQAIAVGIPGPEVLATGVADETAYMIQAFVNGDNGIDAVLGKSDDIWRRLGEYAKLIHSIPVNGYGENLVDPAKGEFHSPSHAGSDGSWQGYIQYNVNCMSEQDPLIKLGVITPAQSIQIRALFEDLKSITFDFGLNHGDLSLKNTMITPDNQLVLIDWGNAEVGVIPQGTVMQLMHYQLLELEEAPAQEELEAFLDGYGIRLSDLPKLKHLLLLKAFDNLRWAMDHRPDLVEPYSAYAKQVVGIVL